jgi:hypothetical protein
MQLPEEHTPGKQSAMQRRRLFFVDLAGFLQRKLIAP